MSKIHFLQTKESLIGIGLLVGLVLLLIINIVIVTTSVVGGYQTKQIADKAQTIDDSTLSQAIKLLETKE